MRTCGTLTSLIATGLRFEEIADVEVWHSDVRAFSVFDLSSNELLGYFYLDIHPRLLLSLLKVTFSSLLSSELEEFFVVF